MNLLVTGFEPFGGHSSNPSSDLALEISQSIPGSEYLILPVSFQKAGGLLVDQLNKQDPDCVISLGLSQKLIDHFAFECVALNMEHSEASDNDGDSPFYRPIDQLGDLALHTTWPLTEEMFSKELKPSFHAGTFVCNGVYYRLLSWAMEQDEVPDCCFIHLPFLGRDPSPSLDQAKKTLIDSLLA